MIFRVFTRSLLAVLFAISGSAQFEIRGSRLYLEGNRFPIRGVAYSPTPIGERAGPVLRLSGCLYSRDLALAARAGINTIRLYGRVPPGETALGQSLTTNDLYLLAGFPLDPYYDPAASLSPDTEAGRALRARILRDFQEYAGQLRDQRRVIAVVFGNEVARDYTRKFSGVSRDFYTLLEEAAGTLRATLGTSAPLLTTAVADTADIGQATLATRDSDLPGLSFWSVNVFRGIAFGGLFDDLRRRTGKPALVSEFGIDAWDSVRQVEDSHAQAAGLRSLVRSLREELDRPGSTLLGAVWFGWSDEWWRGGPDPARHGAAGEPRAGFPDGVSNPAWFGLFGAKATDLPGLDSLRPRPAFAVLAEEWGGRLPREWPLPKPPRLDPQGVGNSAGIPGSVAPGALVSFFGEALAEAPFRMSAAAPPLGVDLTSACLSSRPVPLLFVDGDQVNGQVPWEAPAGPSAAMVYRAGEASNTVRLEVREFSPGILHRGVVEAGKPCPVTEANGVRPGAYLEVYGTGLGPVAGPPATGSAAAAPRLTDTIPRAFLGPRELRVFYSGLVPGIVGLYQTNTRVPEDFPAFSPVALRLVAGGVESNSYPFTVVADSETPRLLLGAETLSFVVQAGGPPQSVELSIEGRNGFCELVRFSAVGLPEGVSASVPVGYPGLRVPVAIRAAPDARETSEYIATLLAQSPASENPVVRLRIAVLPSRGDIPFRVVSGGARAGLIARFEMAGRLLHEARGGGPGRGFNFLFLNGETGVLGPARQFDTWLSEKASEEMADYLAALPSGAVVLGAIADEGTLHLTPRTRTVLRQVLRSQRIDGLRYQDSWAIITRVGAATPIAEDAAPDRQITLDRILTFPMP